ncbi:hypothetical protein MN1_050 [Thermus phage MN1]|nr:hypothetical protein MN1_050 [Thermus phage MN1]
MEIETVLRPLLALLVEFSRAVITAYGVMEIVYFIGLLLGGRQAHLYTLWGAIGGMLWIVGLWLWKQTAPQQDVYSLSLLLRSCGVALMLLPHLFRRMEER